jgi:hypothetical protein
MDEVVCSNCGTVMEPDKGAKTRVIRCTEYACPNGCPSRLVGRALPRGVPRAVTPTIETRAETEQFADALLEGIVGTEEEPEMEDNDGG